MQHQKTKRCSGGEKNRKKKIGGRSKVIIIAERPCEDGDKVRMAWKARGNKGATGSTCPDGRE